MHSQDYYKLTKPTTFDVYVLGESPLDWMTPLALRLVRLFALLYVVSMLSLVFSSRDLECYQHFADYSMWTLVLSGLYFLSALVETQFLRGGRPALTRTIQILLCSAISGQFGFSLFYLTYEYHADTLHSSQQYKAYSLLINLSCFLVLWLENIVNMV